MRCGWCETVNAMGAERCVSCGGAVRQGNALGPPPPDAPRELPRRFEERVVRAASSFGLLFGLVGALTSAGFVVGTLLFPPMVFGLLVGLVFVAVGVGTVRSGRSAAHARFEALRTGVAVIGQVESVARAGDEWRLVYGFAADGRRHTAQASTDDAEITRFEAGDPIHVVYVPDDPARSEVWPPLR